MAVVNLKRADSHDCTGGGSGWTVLGVSSSRIVFWGLILISLTFILIGHHHSNVMFMVLTDDEAAMETTQNQQHDIVATIPLPKEFASTDVLFQKGHPLQIVSKEEDTTIEYSVKIGSITKVLRLAVEPTVKKPPRADGDEAMQYIVDRLDLPTRCAPPNNSNTNDDNIQQQQQQQQSSFMVIDVGGLHGDFGLSTAARGCPTVIFEPQPDFAHRIATSIGLNNLHHLASVHWAAASTAADDDNDNKVTLSLGGGQTKVVDSGGDNVVHVATETLDENFGDQRIIFLKVDVEGHEDKVFHSAHKLFSEGRILHTVWEYTPKQFEDRATDYKTFLSRLYGYGATVCYTLHRRKPILYRLRQNETDLFYSTMYRQRMQTDVYCSFEKDYDPFPDSDHWSPSKSLL